MTVRRLSAVDAQTYWMSAKIPNDTVLLYGFAGVPADLDRRIEQIAVRGPRLPRPGGAHRRRRAPHLSRVGASRRRPLAVRRARHRGPHIQGCLDQVECRSPPTSWMRGWRRGGCMCSPTSRAFPARRAQARSRYFRSRMRSAAGGEPRRPPRSCSAGPMASSRGSTPRRARLVSVCRSWGFVPPERIAGWSKTPMREGFRRRPICVRRCGPTRVPAGPRHLRTVVGRRSDLSGPTVTVAALSAVSVALC